MKILRLVGLFLLMGGFGLLSIYMYQVVNSGEIIGSYPVAARQVQDLADFLSTLRKSGMRLLIGKEVERKLIGTDFFSFAPDTGEVEFRLIIKKKGKFRRNDTLFSPTFFLMDENNKEVFRKEVHGGMGPMSGINAGLNSKFAYTIGTFRPENLRKY